jgi:hypothetical protein
VFVTSKSYIYITPHEAAATAAAATPQAQIASAESHSIEPIYENIENGNIVPSDDNKFTIYVNYDEIIKGGKCKSSVRLLEPDVTLIRLHQAADDIADESTNDNDDNEVENNSKTMSKMIQCQQVSMYIGEKKARATTNPAMEDFSFITSKNHFKILKSFSYREFRGER